MLASSSASRSASAPCNSKMPQADARLSRPVAVLPDYPVNESPASPSTGLPWSGSAARFQWALDAAADAKGRCLGSQGIVLIINKVQNVILAKGYVTTRVMAQEQDLTTGVLTLTLQPGVSVRPALRNRSLGVGGCGTLFRPRAAIFSTCAISNRGWRTSGGCPALMPTLKSYPAPRMAPVTCRSTGTRRPVRLSLGVDDSGSKSTGRYLGSATLAIDAPLAQNDLFYANIGKDMFQHGPFGNRSHTLNYFFPVGYWASRPTTTTTPIRTSPTPTRCCATAARATTFS